MNLQHVPSERSERVIASPLDLVLTANVLASTFGSRPLVAVFDTY